MKHVFRNEPPKVFELLPEGDYLLEVVKADCAISKGRKTNGAEMLEFKLRSVEHGAEFEESLIDHESCSWKIDQFVNSFGLTSTVGEEVDLDPDNLIGRRGWCKVIQELMTQTDGTPWISRQTGKQGVKNRVAVYYTDKPKVPRNPAFAQPALANAGAMPSKSNDPDWD